MMQVIVVALLTTVMLFSWKGKVLRRRAPGEKPPS
jgi:hypothetical protein